MKIAYADPPYPGCADLYRDHPDYAGEVDHRALVAQLETDYDAAFVARVLQADAAPVEATFDNVVNMLDWLERD